MNWYGRVAAWLARPAELIWRPLLVMAAAVLVAAGPMQSAGHPNFAFYAALAAMTLGAAAIPLALFGLRSSAARRVVAVEAPVAAGESWSDFDSLRRPATNGRHSEALNVEALVGRPGPSAAGRHSAAPEQQAGSARTDARPEEQPRSARHSVSPDEHRGSGRHSVPPYEQAGSASHSATPDELSGPAPRDAGGLHQPGPQPVSPRLRQSSPEGEPPV